MTQEWEYRAENVDTSSHDVEGQVNAYGRLGWELVAAVADPVGYRVTLFFKRPTMAQTSR